MVPLDKHWFHGNVTYLGFVVWVKKVNVGTMSTEKTVWYSRIDDEERQLTVTSGPWITQKEAEEKLCSWLNNLVNGCSVQKVFGDG